MDGFQGLDTKIDRRLSWLVRLLVVATVVALGIFYGADIVRAAPSFSVSGETTADGNTIVTAAISNVKSGTQKYQVVTGTAPTTCDASTGTYGSSGVVFNSSRGERAWVCWKAEDNAGVVGYSSPFEVVADNIAPRGLSATLNETTRVVTASTTSQDVPVNENQAWRHHRQATDFACDNTSAAWGTVGNTVTLTSQQINKTQYICFRAVDWAGNYSHYKYVHSADTTPPTITTSVSGNTVTAASAADDLDAGTWKHLVKSGGAALICNPNLSYSRSGSTYTRTGTGLEHVCFTVSDTSGNAGYSTVVTLAAVVDSNPNPNPQPNPDSNPGESPTSNPNPAPETSGLTIEIAVDGNTLTASSTVSNLDTNTWQYLVTTDSSINCKTAESDLYIGGGKTVTLTTEQRQSNQYICFKVSDTGGNFGYAKQTVRALATSPQNPEEESTSATLPSGETNQETTTRSSNPTRQTENRPQPASTVNEQQPVDETAPTTQTGMPSTNDSRPDTKLETNESKDAKNDKNQKASNGAWLWLILLLVAAGAVGVVWFKNRDVDQLEEEPEPDKDKKKKKKKGK